jgi:hypothetical protein
MKGWGEPDVNEIVENLERVRAALVLPCCSLGHAQPLASVRCTTTARRRRDVAATQQPSCGCGAEGRRGRAALTRTQGLAWELQVPKFLATVDRVLADAYPNYVLR